MSVAETVEYIKKAKLGKHIVVKLDDDNYVYWSSVVDAPVAWGATREEMEEIMTAWADVFSHPAQAKMRLEALDQFGTTEMLGRPPSVECTVSGNHAGPNGEQLTLDALRRYYGPGDAHDNFELRPEDVIPWED